MVEMLGHAVPPAAERHADDHHAARRLPGRGGRTRSSRCCCAWRSSSACGATARSRCSCVCEEAHRYAPADRSIGFGPTRKAVSRIAKEGRKYGVFLGLITQRPAELDATIISQCSTLFAMRMANDRDQAIVRSAVSDAAGSLIGFVPSLGTREVFAFGEGVALPTRLRFKELAAAPHSAQRRRSRAPAWIPRRASTSTSSSRWSSAGAAPPWATRRARGPRSAARLQRGAEAEFERYRSAREPASSRRVRPPRRRRRTGARARPRLPPPSIRKSGDRSPESFFFPVAGAASPRRSRG